MSNQKKENQNPFYWKSVEAKDVKPGNIISRCMSTTPRVISNVIVNGDTVSLYEQNGKHETFYQKVTTEHKFDILMNKETAAPATRGELYA